MKFPTLAAVAAISLISFSRSAPISSNTYENLPPCKTNTVRKELLSLNPTEWQTVTHTVNAMKEKGWLSWFAFLHYYYFNIIHNCEMFFPFHRTFVSEFERIGQRFHPDFFQPYWDEMRDYRNPPSSEVLTAKWIGGNGIPGSMCVEDGNMKGWNITFPNNRCLQRNYTNDGKMQTWYSPEYINSIIQYSNNMTVFRPDIEYTIHGIVHVDVGGDMDTMPSPNDWMFMLHHANIDRMWWEWQNNGHTWTMDGVLANGQPINLNTIMPYYNQPVGTAMKMGTGRLCYSYQQPPSSTNTTSSNTTVNVTNVSANGTLVQGGSNKFIKPSKRDTSYNSPITMKKVHPASSESDSNLAHDNLVKTLPKNLLQKYFPQYAAESLRDDTLILNHTYSNVNNLRSIAPPGELTDAWLDMHNIDRAAYNKIKARALQFVNDLNQAGYQSPY